MKTLNRISGLERNTLSNYELNIIRGGGSGGGTSELDDDILLYDPIPPKKEKNE